MAMKLTTRFVWTIMILGMLSVVGVVTVFAFSLGKYEKVKASAGTVSIPLSKLADGKTHFYRIDDNGKEIAFFVVKAPDGSYRTAFNACDVCYHEKKGYEQVGNAVVCKNCNKRFAINRIGPHEVGGCNPSYLPSQISGNAITISMADLKAGARFF